jgi:5-formyltetrahydrofolate cyclo-ligase
VSDPGASDAKARHRAGARAARAGVSAEARAAAADAVAWRALAVPGVGDARAVLAYSATADELDPAPLVYALRAHGARVAYPRVCGPGALALHWCDDASALAPGYCGIAEPSAETPEADAAEIDLVLVPGTAFDEACGRLGMGGGFYDRLLPRLASGALAIGLAFDEQLVSEVPREAHDVPLSAVVTPTRTILPRG